MAEFVTSRAAGEGSFFRVANGEGRAPEFAAHNGVKVLQRENHKELLIGLVPPPSPPSSLTGVLPTLMVRTWKRG